MKIRGKEGDWRSGAETKRTYLYSVEDFGAETNIAFSSEFSETFDSNYKFRSLLPSVRTNSGKFGIVGLRNSYTRV